MQSGSGNDNEGEVAISAPISIDLDGEDEPELLVAYGERIFAFDGDTELRLILGSAGHRQSTSLTAHGHHLQLQTWMAMAI